MSGIRPLTSFFQETPVRRLPSVCLALAAALLLPLSLPAADDIFPFPYTVDDLDNGLRVVTVDTGFPDLVGLYVVVNVGSRHEVEPGHSGFAHLFEHMMFRGTPDNPPEQWQRIMEEAGASTNAYTTDDRTVYHALFSKPDLERILALEADRFQNLSYSEEVFRTESRAVLGEYNKNSASPFRKLLEGIREEAFEAHTYKHTTMGFIEDIKAMPEMYDYGLKFFDRFYKPEYATVCVVGDVSRDSALPLVKKYWGNWKRGDYKPDIPTEPKQKEPKEIDIAFHAPTTPMLALAYKSAAYDDEVNDSAVLDIISYYAFSENSDLFRKLVITDQTAEMVTGYFPDHMDPELFTIIARVKKEDDIESVRQSILGTVDTLQSELVPAEELQKIKDHLRYGFAMSLNSTESIADTLAHFVSVGGSPETINKRYALYQSVTPEDVMRVAKKTFAASNRTIATLVHDPEAGDGN